MTQDEIKQILREARALIGTPKQWTQGASQRNSIGISVARDHPDVATRCMAGAIEGACPCADPHEQVEIFDFLMDSIDRYEGKFNLALSRWNDKTGRTHADVMQAFDRAIGEST